MSILRTLVRRLTRKQASQLLSSPASMEPLEDRTLLSVVPLTATPFFLGGTSAAPAAITPTPTPTQVAPVGVSIQAVVGIPFSGDVGMLTGLSPTLLPRLQATINWGDSQTTQGTLYFDTAGVLHVQGVHAYDGVGSFPVTVRVIQNPPKGTTGPSILYTINSKAQVTQNSVGGVTIFPPLKKLFTATVGTFTYAAPASPVNMTLIATINWGDGLSSVGKIVLNSSGTYDVVGGHTYAARGVFRITIVVAQVATGPGPTPAASAAPMLARLIATIYSTAVVQAAATSNV